ncbi:AAA family ATPase [Mesorhizobium sp. BR-1-1-8]|uniref:AAA family ATPase n=1 Tax=unclassified Mesorhizobium TaxID=325217 RepID=UPI001CCEB834|nr:MULTISPECIES: AAA family ATPase [unclassified Mesorhizobium]MBZ9973488.1 AAA family ATPase [Mesorhizobium sp. BR1-1-12]MBZ9984953.1 AAA family ATPase [Mesorhizobium sp. BR-1-1-8]
MTPLEVARWYTGHGIPVFPCHESEAEEVDPATGEIITKPEKSPYTTNGLKGATRSSRIVDIFFGEKYPSAAIGVPTGEPLGAWVLDLDTHDGNDGHVWLAEMEAKHGPLPDTARASTANGGTHIFFHHVDGVRNRAAIAPGVDTRGDGGYILAPGSAMADGRAYKWLNHDGHGLPAFAEAPQWLLDLVVNKHAEPTEQRTEYVYRPVTSENERYVSRAIEDECAKVASAAVGNRGQQLYSSACALGEIVAAGALARADAESELYRAAESSGVVKKDGPKSTRDRIKRGLDKTANSPRQIPVREMAPSSDPTDMVAAHDAKKAAPKMEPTAEPTATTPKKKERFEKTWFDEIEEGAPKETLIKGMLGVGEYTTISGLPGTGKSVIVTDLACHVAAGMDWHGRKLKKRGLVIYVAAERKKLTERRMMAFRKHHGVKDVPLLVVGGRLDFTRNLDDARSLIALIKEAETETDLPCVWVIIDTLTRVFGAGDQNASKDMTRFVQSCDEILIATQAHVSAIHHSAWSGERGKGAIDLDGAVDASYMVKKENGKYRLVCDGTNDGDEGDILAFKMESIELSKDADGEPTNAPVVVKLEPDTVPTSGTLKGYKGDVLAALTVAIDRDGIQPEGDAFPEDVNVVDLETWKKHFYATRDMESISVAATTKKQFQRAPDELVKACLVNHVGLWYWAT